MDQQFLTLPNGSSPRHVPETSRPDAITATAVCCPRKAPFPNSVCVQWRLIRAGNSCIGIEVRRVTLTQNMLQRRNQNKQPPHPPPPANTNASAIGGVYIYVAMAGDGPLSDQTCTEIAKVSEIVVMAHIRSSP